MACRLSLSDPVSRPLLFHVRLLAMCGAIAVLASCGGDGATGTDSNNLREDTPQTAVSGPERLIVAFGDSLYAGYQLKPGEGLAPVLEQSLRGRGINARVVAAGVSGDTTAAGLQRFNFTLDGQPRKPDLIVLGLGGNDLLRGLDPAQTAENMEQMLAEAKRRGIPVVLTGMVAPPNVGPEFQARFNALYPDLAREYDAALLPFFMEPLAKNRSLLQPDGIHPTAQGVKAMAAPLVPIVADELAETIGSATR